MSTEGLIKIRIPLPEKDWHSYASETLWTESAGNNQYKLRNAPFFTDDLSYGDTVYATEDEMIFLYSNLLQTEAVILLAESFSKKNQLWKNLRNISNH